MNPTVNIGSRAARATLQSDAGIGVLSASQEELAIYVGGPVFVVLVGLLFAYLSAGPPLRRALALVGMQSFDPRSTGASDGLVAVQGTVDTAGESVTGPVTDEACTAYGHQRQRFQYGYKYDEDKRRELRRRTDVDDERANKRTFSWNTASTEEASVPFHVETEHGPVAVEPEGATLQLPVRADERPSRLRTFLFAAHPLTGNTIPGAGLLRRLPLVSRFTPERPTREVERNLQHGDDVLVIREADVSPSQDTDVVGRIEDGTGDGEYLISTRSRSNLLARSIYGVCKGSMPLLLTLGLAALMVYGGTLEGVY